LEDLGMKKVGIFYGHLEYIKGIWYILWPFGKLMAFWYIFPVLVYCVKKYPAALIICGLTVSVGSTGKLHRH
jgi:hypothetical protein